MNSIKENKGITLKQIIDTARNNHLEEYLVVEYYDQEEKHRFAKVEMFINGYDVVIKNPAGKNKVITPGQIIDFKIRGGNHGTNKRSKNNHSNPKSSRSNLKRDSHPGKQKVKCE